MSTAVLLTGIDLVEIVRIERAVTRWGPRFLQRVYTATELQLCAGRAQALAGRWAAKEAAAKALGVGLRGLGAQVAVDAPQLALEWSAIEVVRSQTGAPVLRLHGKAVARAEALGVREVALSLSHTATLAIASVVMSGP